MLKLGLICESAEYTSYTSSGWVYKLELSTLVLSTPSSSPPVMPISISSQIPIGAIRLKYLTHVAMFCSFGSSERSSMWEENRGSWCSLKYASSASSMPSNQARSFSAQWSECRTTGLMAEPRVRGANDTWARG